MTSVTTSAWRASNIVNITNGKAALIGLLFLFLRFWVKRIFHWQPEMPQKKSNELKCVFHFSVFLKKEYHFTSYASL